MHKSINKDQLSRIIGGIQNDRPKDVILQNGTEKHSDAEKQHGVYIGPFTQ